MEKKTKLVKFVLRLPPELKARATLMANAQGRSLNSFIVETLKAKRGKQ